MKKTLILVSAVLALITAVVVPAFAIEGGEKKAETKVKTIQFPAELVITGVPDPGVTWVDPVRAIRRSGA